MDPAQSDLVDWYKLETEFFQDHVRHTRYVEGGENGYRKVKEDWSDCEELGTGGFGVVYKQVLGTTGRYRAVKTVNKKRLPAKLDYSRELLIMAILAKHPLLFVKFLGWYEKPETLYIAMEYLPEGDLAKHIGSPLRQETVQTISKQILEGLKVMHQKGIAHRDLKPANIFVVSMSPVRVKLGDFGISKRVLPQAATALETQVSTQIYGAPEVLGVDSTSESSEYTNSVDIWSLGCVIFELLVGKPLFASYGHVYHYYHGKGPFPEDQLKGLPTPTDDVGISLLKSMLANQPEDRPTAADALGNSWFAGLKSDDEDDQDETTQSGDARTYSRESEGKLTTRDEPKEIGGQRDPITQDNSRYPPEDVALGANPESQWGSDPTTPKAEISPATIIQGAEEKTDPQYFTNMPLKPPASGPPTLDPYRENSAQPALGMSGLERHIPKCEAPASLLSLPTTRTMDWRTYPAQRTGSETSEDESSEDESWQNSPPNSYSRGDGGSWGSPPIDPMKNPNTRQNSNAGQNPNAGWNPNQNPNAGWNPNQNPNAGWNPNQNPNAGWNPNQNPNASSNPNWNSNINSNPNQNPNASWDPNQNPNLRWNLRAGGNPNTRWNSSAQGDRNLGPNQHLLGLG